jgi:hypothetical protein
VSHSAAAPDGAGEFTGVEADRREQALSGPSHRRAFQGRPSMMEDIRARRYSGKKKPVVTHVCPAPPHTYVPPPPAQENLPIQRAVDRTELFEPTTVDIEIRDPNGKVLEILRFPVRGRYGSDPNDVPWMPEQIDPSAALCGILAPYAALRCVAMGGAW